MNVRKLLGYKGKNLGQNDCKFFLNTLSCGVAHAVYGDKGRPSLHVYLRSSYIESLPKPVSTKTLYNLLDHD